ncbi:DNA topoisomerase 2-like [Triticum dicoccoides]|uniref:DNA topoisomerase 2-like n=1 Tax=Triticum dicoccoides TaxID=85692 RepID=UPI0018906120|nr:DNA topoisomerase 2-like [Triticum dicoccoides]
MYYDENDLGPFSDPDRSTPPSMVDGLKPWRRKVLLCAFKKDLVKGEIQVAEFSDYVSKQSAYQHAEQCLACTVIEMAQDFVGTNNISLFTPSGQFGTRSTGGLDCCDAKYLYTRLARITRLIFPKEDDVLLNYLNEDGKSVEPTWYMPIIPMVLVNGTGIDNESNSYVPNYNPRDIIANLKRLLNGQTVVPMDPWYKGFKGTLKKTCSKAAGVTYTTAGVIEEVDGTKLKITELPIRCWTSDYDEFLESICPISVMEEEKAEDKNKEPSFLEKYQSRCDRVSLEFEVILSEKNMNIAKKEGLQNKFNLETTIGTSNMHLSDSNGKIQKYDTPEDILREFFKLRLEYYSRRKEVMLNNIGKELLKPKNQVRFILAVNSGDIVFNNKKRAELFLELKQKGYERFPNKIIAAKEPFPKNKTMAKERLQKKKTMAKEVDEEDDYEYLLALAIGTLTLEKVQELVARQKKLEDELESLGKTTPEILWLRDLAALEKELDVLDAKEAEQEIRRRLAKNSIVEKVRKAALKKQPKKTAAEPQKVQISETNDKTAAEPQKVQSETNDNTAAKPQKANCAGSDDEDFETKPAAQKKKRPNKASAPVTDDEDEALELKDRLAIYNFDDSSLEHNAIKTETTEGQQERKEGRNEASKIGTAKNAMASLTELSGENKDNKFAVEEVQVEKKSGGRKPAALKPKKTTNRKRAPAQSNSGDPSPGKKVRKMSDSNKENVSVLQRVASASTGAEDAEPCPPSGSSAQPVAPRRSARLKQSTSID